jgi:hypothetical protein
VFVFSPPLSLQVACDIGINNTLGVYNTGLLRSYALLGEIETSMQSKAMGTGQQQHAGKGRGSKRDASQPSALPMLLPIRALGLLVKLWAKRRGVNDPSKGTPSSYW